MPVPIETLFLAVLQAAATMDMNAFDMFVKTWGPTTVNAGGWLVAARVVAKQVASFGTRQDAHEGLNNIRFENVRMSAEVHGQQVQLKMDEAMGEFHKAMESFAGLKASVEARLPERRDGQRMPRV